MSCQKKNAGHLAGHLAGHAGHLAGHFGRTFLVHLMAYTGDLSIKLKYFVYSEIQQLFFKIFYLFSILNFNFKKVELRFFFVKDSMFSIFISVDLCQIVALYM